MYDIVIVGGGPAGLTAAIYGARASLKVLVLEANSCGGQIINTLDIENYPAEQHISGFDFVNKLYEQVKNLGVDIIFEKVLHIKNGKKIKKVITEKHHYDAKAIILATGCANRKLLLPNEDNFIGKGISYCATCDGSFYKGKIVAVVGGGDTALEDTLHLSNLAQKVYLIHRRDTFKGTLKTLNLIKEKDNIEILLNSRITSIYGNDKLESIGVTSTKPQTILVDGLFIAIGKNPENECFSRIVNLDANGYVCAKEDCHTNKKGIFVAGDIRRKRVRQLVTAVSDGAISAMEAIHYIQEEHSLNAKK